MKSVIVLGGTSIFGGRIAAGLAESKDIHVKIASRHPEKATTFAKQIGAELVQCDASDAKSLESIVKDADLLIHTAGPFQGNDYRVAQTCIDNGVHYLDISDGREFVCGITGLDSAAKKRGVVVGSGASSVPTITNAMIEEISGEFTEIDTIQIALSPGNQNPRGASTIGSILTYLGRPIQVWENNNWQSTSGWSDRRRLEFPDKVGKRDVFRCEVPDMDLFPTKWNARTLRFHAGVELNIINRSLSAIGWARQYVPMPWLPELAGIMTSLSRLLFPLGSKNGALSIWITGSCHNTKRIERRIAIVTDDDGPATPSAPGILLARKILIDNSMPTGAYPCDGFLSFAEVTQHLKKHGVWHVKGDDSGWYDAG